MQRTGFANEIAAARAASIGGVLGRVAHHVALAAMLHVRQQIDAFAAAFRALPGAVERANAASADLIGLADLAAAAAVRGVRAGIDAAAAAIDLARHAFQLALAVVARGCA